jgi:hypothetical protein
MLSFVLFGCDGYCHIDLIIMNQTDSNIIVELNANNKQLTIKPSEKQTVDRQGGTCSRGGSLSYKDNVPMTNAVMKINGETIPEAIWTNKFWELNIHNSISTYTLIVTNELIEIMKNEKLQ